MQPVSITDTVKAEPSPPLKCILDKVSISDSLTDSEKQECLELIAEYQDICSTSSTDIGSTDKVHHYIELIDPTPFKQKYRRIPPVMIEEFRQHIQELLAAGIIRPSHSPFSSTVVLVKKHDESLRM